MSYVPYARRSFSGTAPDTSLTANVDNATLTVAITDGSGWPDGSGGNFVVTFEPGTTNEEKALASSRSGNTLTLVQRGLEGSAVSHTASSVIRHGLAALDVNEANYAVSQTVGLVAAKGDLLVGSAANTLVKVSKGTAGQTPVWQSDGSIAPGSPAPAAHVHAETDVTQLVQDLSTMQSQQDSNTAAIAALQANGPTLAYAAGALSVDAAATASFATLLSATLAAGTWLVTSTVTVLPNASLTFQSQIVASSGTVTGNAATECSNNSGSQYVTLTCSALVTASSSFTLSIQARSSSANGTFVAATSSGSAGATGYTAVKVA